MEIQRTRDQQRISRLVRAFVSPSTGVGERIAVADELRAAIRSPSDILNCGTIPEDHALKQDALAVRDAFEAVTNGMSSPEAEEAMDAISRDAVFAPWVLLVRAIKDFYSGDAASAEAWAARIPAGSFPARAVRIFRSLDPRRRSVPGAEPEGGLGAALFPDEDALPKLVEEIREALDQGLPDFASVRALRLVRELMDRPGADPKAAALAVLGEIDSRGSDPDPFIQGLRGLLGESETLRLVALYLRSRDPSLGLLYWLKAAVLSVRDSDGAEGLRPWIAAARAFTSSLGGEALAGREAEYDAILGEIESIAASAGAAARPTAGRSGKGSGAAALERLEGIARSLGAHRDGRTGKAVPARATGGMGRNSQLALFPERS